MAELHIGTLATGDVGTDEPFILDTARFEDEGLRIGVFASSGAGKGYLLGVLLEELHSAGYPLLIIDPESELWTFREVGALVIGGPHGHVPFDRTAAAAIAEAVTFAYDTATPVVFDLDGLGDVEIREAFEAIAGPYWSLINKRRRPFVLAITEAHLVAPQVLPRGAAASGTLPRIMTGGRKRGAITLVETQRVADIANNVIAQCNVRAIGRFDLEDDYKRVGKSMPKGVTLADVSALTRGSFYFPRLAKTPVVVRERLVTHGGGTPGGGEVTLQRDVTPRAMQQMAARLATLIEESDSAGVSAPTPPQAPAPKDRRRGARNASLERRSEPPAGPVAHPDPRVDGTFRALEEERDAARRQLVGLRRELDEAQRQALSAESEAAHYQTLAEEQEVQLHAWNAMRDALATAVGAGASGSGPGALTEERVVALIRQHAPAASQGAALMPIEALRKDYLERSAQRLTETMSRLETDERAALLFLLAHPGMQTLNAVAKGLSGSDSGSVRQRWSKALQSLSGIGLAHTATNGTRRANVDAWVRSALSPHAPTDDEVQDVINRALYVLQRGG